MSKIKKRILVSLIILFVIVPVPLTVLYIYSAGNPGLRFLLTQNKVLPRLGVNRKEINFKIGDTEIPAFHYFSNKKSDKYYFFIHGLTPLGYKHPRMDSIARSFVNAADVNVLLPEFTYFIKKNQNGKTISISLIDIYKFLYKNYKGKYRAFAACIGAPMLLNAMNHMPREILPEKVFLVGPYNNGKGLLPVLESGAKKENKKIDFIVRLSLSSRNDKFSEQEKNLIEKALKATKPGKTDTTRMKKILGSRLFNNIRIFKFTHDDIKDFNVENPGLAEHFSKTRFFILHSNQDFIIPFQEGKALSKRLKKTGADVSFLGTEFISHTENTVTVSGLYQELKYLIKFFNTLLKGDVPE